MINKVIKKIKSLKKVFIPKSEFEEKKLECVVDDKKVNCSTFKESSWIGYPAPISLPTDPWFGSAPKTQKVIHHEKKVAAEYEIKEKQRKEETQEPQNIHQVMYEKATKNQQGSWQENIGGSENFQSGPGGWMSSTGMRQFVNE